MTSLRPLCAVIAVSIASLSLSMSASAQAQTPPTAPSAAEQQSTITLPIRAARPQEIAAVLNSLFGPIAVASDSASMLILTGREDVIAAAKDRAMQLEVAARDSREQQEWTAHLNADNERERLRQLSLNIEFPGGRVGEYLELVQKLSGFGNVVVTDDRVFDLRMPKVQVKRVTGSAAVLLLESLRFNMDETSVNLTVQQIPGDPDGLGIDALPILIVDMHVPNGSAGASASPAIRTDVFDLTAIQKYEPAQLKALLEAIDIAMTLNGKSAEFSTKFHEGSGLFFAKGTPEDLAMVERTISRLNGPSNKAPAGNK